jgi:hypothetical protein
VQVWISSPRPASQQTSKCWHLALLSVADGSWQLVQLCSSALHTLQGCCVLVATGFATGLVQADSFITNQVEVSPMMIQVGAHQMYYTITPIT